MPKTIGVDIRDVVQLSPSIKRPDLPFCTDQWQPIHAKLLELAAQVKFDQQAMASVTTPQATFLHVVPRQLAVLIDQMRYSDDWRDFVFMGRGLGRYPNPPFKQFRDYRYGAASIGATHTRLFQEKGINACELCGGQAFDGKFTCLDYFAFYPTGEVFVWTDPLFMNGFLPVDPRNPEQSEDSPLAVKWLCKYCYVRLREIGYDRSQRYEKRYAYLLRSFQPSPPSRFLVDRRVWLPVNYVNDRRSPTPRRADDVSYSHAHHLAATDPYTHPPSRQR